MINPIHSGIIAITAMIAFNSPSNITQTNASLHFDTAVNQQNDAALIGQLNELCTKHLRASGIASQQGGEKVKAVATRLSLKLSQFNEEIRNLAKSKSIALSSTLPEGGQRPDGRTDASPENLKDTSRIRYGSGEAGNSGNVKTNPIGINDASSNALVSSLKKLKGSAFDKAYKNLLISDRNTAEKLLESTSRSSDSAISAFAKKYLEKLKAAKW
jgi:putative membrane protein